MVTLAQLVAAEDCGSSGPGFKPQMSPSYSGPWWNVYTSGLSPDAVRIESSSLSGPTILDVILVDKIHPFKE